MYLSFLNIKKKYPNPKIQHNQTENESPKEINRTPNYRKAENRQNQMMTATISLRFRDNCSVSVSYPLCD